MIDRHFLTCFLRLNNVDPQASPGEVRAVLESARWPQEDIEHALALCAGSENRIDVPFRPDMQWSSPQLSSLLGVDVVVDPAQVKFEQGHMRSLHRIFEHALLCVSICTAALGVAALLGFGLMYYLEIGPFHSTEAWLSEVEK